MNDLQNSRTGLALRRPRWQIWFYSACFLAVFWLGVRYLYRYLDGMIEQPSRARVALPDEMRQDNSLLMKQPTETAEATKPVAGSSIPALPSKPKAPEQRIAAERLLLHTVGGDILVALYPDVAPVTVRQFLQWVRLGVFDSTHFSRLEPGFVLQTSLAEDRVIPFRPEQVKSLRMLPGEFSKTLKHRKGVLSMGRDDGQPDSARTSFSILLGDAPHLDGKYTIFGHVEAGMEVVERLSMAPRAAGSNRPETRLTIMSVQVVHQDDLSQVQLEKPVELGLIQQQFWPREAVNVAAVTILKHHCWKCHGDQSIKGELDLTNATGMKSGGERGPVYLPSDPQKSSLLLRITAGDEERMPPHGKGHALHQEEIRIISRWLSDGAAYPPAYYLKKQPLSARDSLPGDTSHWFFQPLMNGKPQEIRNTDWIRNEIDAFILAKLQEHQLRPVEPASPTVLRRRIAYGLTGLPPAAEQKGTHAQQIEQLLLNQHFGEHMARSWLDLVRFAESDGYEDDTNRPEAYHYRDFVIRAFNDDMPFDQFLRWQIAGDELAADQPAARAATGYLAAGPFQTFFAKKKDRYDELDDIVATTGAAFMGMTVGCARCHDHKHDPITQHEYYRMVSVFHGSQRKVEYLDLAAGGQHEQQRQPLEKLLKEFAQFTAPAREKARNKKIDALSIEPHEKAALKRPYDPENSFQMSLLQRFEHLIQVNTEEAREHCDDDDRTAWDILERNIKDTESRLPPSPERGLVYTGSRLLPANFLERGDPQRESQQVPPGFLTALTRARPVWHAETYKAWGLTPRSAFANWLTDIEDGAGQQVARVIVNRLWKHHFGVGLVDTANDFGLQGSKPTHPQLLDFLARKLIDSGWKLKSIHRLILQSSTYQLSGRATAALQKADPGNQLFARHAMQRLSAEMIRDSILAVSGKLNRELYGKSIKPPIPQDAIFPTAPKHGEVWPADAAEKPENWRRSLYIYAKRSNPVPFLQLFDAPDAAISCSARQQSTTPVQSLALLNDQFVLIQCRILAQQIGNKVSFRAEDAIVQAYRAILMREPGNQELQIAMRFLQKQQGFSSKEPKLAALTDLCHALLMSNVFLYVE